MASLGSVSAGPMKQKALVSRTPSHLSPERCCALAPEAHDLRHLRHHRRRLQLDRRGHIASAQAPALVIAGAVLGRVRPNPSFKRTRLRRSA